MDEVDASRLSRVLSELAYICQKGKPGDEKQMKVFNLEQLDAFVQYTAERFYQNVIQSSHIMKNIRSGID